MKFRNLFILCVVGSVLLLVSQDCFALDATAERKRIKDADQLYQTFLQENKLGSKMQLMASLDLRNSYHVQLKAKMQGKIAVRYAEDGEHEKAKKFLKLIDDPLISWGSVVEIGAMSFKKKEFENGLDYVQPALDAICSQSVLGKISLAYIGIYGELAQLFCQLMPLKNNEQLYQEYLKPIYATCGFFPSDRHSISGGILSNVESLLVYQYATALSNTTSAGEIAQILATYLFAEPEIDKSMAIMLEHFSHVADLSVAFQKINATGNESNYQKLYKIMLRPDINGEVWGLEGLKGKYILLDFWASWCTPCRKSHPHLKELYALYKEKGLEMVGIASEFDTNENMRIFNCKDAVKMDETPWIQLLEEKSNIEQYFPIHTSYDLLAKKVLFDKEGVFLGVFEGADKLGLKRKLAELML